MALRGVKVIELAGLAPAPFCGMILAEFGASVTRVDQINGKAHLDCLRNGKSLVALNLKDTKGKQIFRKLCKTSDVLIEPYRKGVMESLNLGPAILLKDNPRLIYARLTGYGQKGDMCSKAGHDINYISLSGLLSLFGRSGAKPTFPVNIGADFAGGGLLCAFGILAALIERNSSGLGQVVDCSMTEGAAYVGSWLYRSQNLPIWGNDRGENVLDSGAHFYEVYETKDKKYLAVGAIEHHFYSELLKGLDLNPEQVPHLENFKENKKIFESKFKEKTQKEWCDIFENLDACVTPVLSLKEAPVYKHNVESDTFVEDYAKENRVPGPSPKLTRTPAQTLANQKPKENGSDTDNVLRKLNYTEEEIRKLDDEGVVKIIKSKL